MSYSYHPGPNAIAVPAGSFFTFGFGTVVDPPVASRFVAHKTFLRADHRMSDGRVVRWDHVIAGPLSGRSYIYILVGRRTRRLENKPGTGLVRVKPSGGS